MAIEFFGTTGRSKTNNNPFNIEYHSGGWQEKYTPELEPVSKSGKQRFSKYPTMEQGWQAGLELLGKYQDKGHSLESFVYKYSPPHENDCEQLIRDYSKMLGIDRKTKLNEVPVEKLGAAVAKRESSTVIKGIDTASVGSNINHAIDRILNEDKPLVPEQAFLQQPISQGGQAKVPPVIDEEEEIPITPTAVTPVINDPAVASDVAKMDVTDLIVSKNVTALKQNMPVLTAGMSPSAINDLYNPETGNILQSIMNKTGMPVGMAYKLMKNYEQNVWEPLNEIGLIGSTTVIPPQVSATPEIKDGLSIKIDEILKANSQFPSVPNQPPQEDLSASIDKLLQSGVAEAAPPIEGAKNAPVISSEKQRGKQVPMEIPGMPLKYDIPLMGASILGAGALLKNPIATAVGGGLVYGAARKAIEGLGGPAAPGTWFLSPIEEQSPELKPYLEVVEQGLQMPAWIYGTKGVLKAAGWGAKLADKYFGSPLRTLSDKYWKVIADWAVENIIVKPAKSVNMFTDMTPQEAIDGWTGLFKPAIEKLRKTPGMEPTVDTIQEGRSYRNMVRALGSRIATQFNELLPSERAEFIRGFTNPRLKPSTQTVTDLLTETKEFLRNEVDSQYAVEFYKEYRSLMLQPFKGQSQFPWPSKQLVRDLQSVEQNYTPGSNVFARVYDKYILGKTPGQLTSKDMRSMMDELIFDPQMPVALKQQVIHLYNLPGKTAVDVGRASNIAMRDFYTSELLKNPNAISTAPGGNYVTSTWHNLKGLNIHKDIETELHSMDKLLKPAEGWYNEWFLPMWKTNKVILRPAAWGRNLISNLILNDMGGMPWYRMDLYSKALKDMRTGSSDYKRFAKDGAFADIFTSEDLGTVSRFAKQSETMFDTAMRMYNNVADPPRHYYGMTEQWFKYAKYLHNLEEGLKPKEALHDAIKWTFNYGETTPFIQSIRTSKFGMPFATWWSKSIPLGVETMINHPLRLGKWYGLYKAWQSNALDKVGMSPEEWETMQKQFTGYMKGGMYALMPWRDEKDQLKMLNLTWQLPFVGDVSEILNRSSNNIWTLLFQSPITSAVTTLASKRLQTGQPLHYDWEKPEVAAAKTFGYLWNLLMPSLTPGGIDYNTIKDALDERPEALTKEEAVAAQFGFKLQSITPEAVKRKKIAMNQIAESEVGMQTMTKLRRALESEKEDIKTDLRSNIRRIWNVQDESAPELSMWEDKHRFIKPQPRRK